MSASPAEEGTDERDEALERLLAAGVGELELSGRLAGVISSWVGDLLGSLGSGVGRVGAGVGILWPASTLALFMGGGGSMSVPEADGVVGSGLISLGAWGGIGSSSSSRSMIRGMEVVVGVCR